MTIDPKRRYLSRNGRAVSIIGPAPGTRHRFAWITSRGYYVTADGHASLTGREHSLDLVKLIDNPEPIL